MRRDTLTEKLLRYSDSPRFRQTLIIILLVMLLAANTLILFQVSS